MLERDPTANIIRPRLRRAMPRPLPDDDLAHALTVAAPLMRAWLTLGIFQGLRCMEIAGVQRETCSRTARRRYWSFSAARGGHERLLPLYPETLRALRAYGMPRSGYVFMGAGPYEDQRYTPNRVSQAISYYLKGPRLAAHDIGVRGVQPGRRGGRGHGSGAVVTVELTSEQLQTEAKWLADQLGPSPIERAVEWPVATPELCAETAAHWRALDELEHGLAEFAGWDGTALRAAAGPPLEVGYHQPWQELLIGAAIKSEHRNLPVDEVALSVVRMAFFDVAVDPHGDWIPTHATHAQESEDPAESLRQALEVLASRGAPPAPVRGP